MLKTIVSFLCIVTLSSEFSTQCILNQSGKDRCLSSICFSHFHKTSEGDVERFDCDEEPFKINKSSCLELLKKHETSSICIGEGNETHCCCISSNPAQICASEKRNTAELTQLWTVKQVLYLIFGHIGLAGIALLLVYFYMKTVEMWPIDNIVIPEESRITTILLAKSLFLVLSLMVIYFPFRKVCMNHPKGVYTTPRYFLYQIFEAGIGPSLYFSFPLVFFLFDFSLYIHVKSVKFINKSGALALSIFKLVTVPLFVYECFLATFDLWQRDHEPGYCRFNEAIWQFMLSHFFIFGYHILIIIQTVLVTRMKIDIEFFQRSSRETQSHVATVLSSQTGETRIESEFSEMVYIHPRIEVEQCTRADSPTANHNILIEWFSLGSSPPCTDLQRLWSKPYLVPQSHWQYFVLPVFVDDLTITNSSTVMSNLE
ncbi:hypothetical protein GCK72_006253 [Caenorhabditis remanei]|uniref:Uncharacterized protein n=1 Tax=Caenorhabditis remanei TaxID=31234 RepID=A0A6A5HHX8_CAERE|nr:hypothetical protein GCK72_006253 [Caenorhabditis remanei]KAF1766297.1 hypothetical protein GCK72_006253 [Caenorhabditis remanei]